MTKTISPQFMIGRKFGWVLLLTVTLMAGLSFVPVTGSNQVHAASCHVVTNPAEQYRYSESTKLTVGYTYKRTVPSWSGCQDINIQDVTNHGNTSRKTCASFRVHFYPSSGNDYTNSWHYVCSAGRYGTIVPIATHVLDGTKYRVEYIANGAPTGSPAVSYKLID